MLIHILFFVIGLGIVMETSELAVRNAAILARKLKVNEYVVGFLIVAIISVFPEMVIAIMSSVQGVPSLGLGTLLGSNVADLTLVFATVVLVSGRNLNVSSAVLRGNQLYLGLLILPLLLGIDGYYSRFDGGVLIVVGVLFYYFLLRQHRGVGLPTASPPEPRQPLLRPLIIFITSIILLLAGSSLAVAYGQVLAVDLSVPPMLVGLIVLGIGTTVPELFFSLRASQSQHDSLALGDILGTVITDATLVIGVLAMLQPFAFDPKLIIVTGLFMVFAAALLFSLMRSDKLLTKNESILLILFYCLFALTEWFLSH